MDSLHTTESQGTNITQTMGAQNSDTDMANIIPFILLATVLIVPLGAVVSITTIVITILKRSKIRAEGTTHNEPVYANILLNPIPSVSDINTQDNVDKKINKKSRSHTGCICCTNV
jgi:hypothetical protein